MLDCEKLVTRPHHQPRQRRRAGQHVAALARSTARPSSRRSSRAPGSAHRCSGRRTASSRGSSCRTRWPPPPSGSGTAPCAQYSTKPIPANTTASGDRHAEARAARARGVQRRLAQQHVQQPEGDVEEGQVLRALRRVGRVAATCTAYSATRRKQQPVERIGRARGRVALPRPEQPRQQVRPSVPAATTAYSGISRFTVRPSAEIGRRNGSAAPPARERPRVGGACSSASAATIAASARERRQREHSGLHRVIAPA